MVLRDISSNWGSSASSWSSSRWSRENCVVSVRARRCEYPLVQQRLSIKAAWGGREECFVDGRRIAVDDDMFLILNDGCIYASRVQSRDPVATFSIFFRPGMAQDVLRAITRSGRKLLDDPLCAGCDTPVEFSPHLRPHDRQITPVLHFIRHHVDRGLTDEGWYEEQLCFLLERMLVAHQNDLRAVQLIPAARASTRKELFRRVGLGADFINTHFADAIGLEDIAVASLLSPYHCLRMFKAVHGCTPNSYLTHKRVQAAERLLRSSSSQVDEVAANVGFQSRTTLFRQMINARGLAPSTIRRIQRESNRQEVIAP